MTKLLWCCLVLLFGHAWGLSAEAIRKSFCNTFSADGLDSYEDYDISGLNAVDFHSYCARCEAGSVCPSDMLTLRSSTAPWETPMCCEVKSRCTCPLGMTSTSCTRNAMENALPGFGLFADTAIPWDQAWQQYWAGQIAHLVVALSRFAHQVSTTNSVWGGAQALRSKKLKDLQKARAALEDAIQPLEFLGNMFDLRDAKALKDLMEGCEEIVDTTKFLEFRRYPLKLALRLKFIEELPEEKVSEVLKGAVEAIRKESLFEGFLAVARAGTLRKAESVSKLAAKAKDALTTVEKNRITSFIPGKAVRNA